MAQGENLDSRLMVGSGADKQRQEEMGYSDRLRQEQLAAKDRERQDAGGGAGGRDESWRERALRARQALNLKEQAKKKLEEKAAAPARAVTNRALQWAWKALIPSWGLSSIWINIHVFLKAVFGEKLFCKLGDEWLPPQAAEATGEAGKMVGKSIGLVEIMVLAFIDIIIFFIIVGFFAMFTDENTFKTMTGEANKAQPAPAVQPVK